jgi:hypothetical protein
MKNPAAGNSFIEYSQAMIAGLIYDAVGELVWPSFVCILVELVPSMIESPKATIAPACLEARTSTPASQYHAGNPDAAASTGMTVFAVKSPEAEMYTLWRVSKCQVAGAVFPGTKMLTARSPRAGTSKSTASLTTSAPAGIVIDGLPPKVSLRSEPGTLAAPAAWRAMRAAPMTRPLAPKVENQSYDPLCGC